MNVHTTDAAAHRGQSRPALTILVLSLSTLVAAIDTNIVNIGLPTISRELHTGFSSAQWVMLSYMLAVTVLIVGVGRIGDLFGKRWIFNAGLLLFSASSLFCGLSGSIAMLIAMRALQGVGGAILMALSFALVGDLIPKEKIMGSMAVLTAMLPIGFALGPTVGGLLLSLGSWRYLFFFNVPLGLAALLLALQFPDDRKPAAESRFDWVGLLLMVAALFAYVMGITRTEDAGMAPETMLLFLGSAAGLLAFLLWERRADAPLVELSMFRSGTFSASLVVSVLVYTVITGNWLIVPFYLQQAKGFSTLASGLLNLSRTVGQTSGTAILGAIFYCFAGTKDLAGAKPAAIVSGIRFSYLIAGMIAAAAFLIGMKWLVPEKGGASSGQPLEKSELPPL